METENKFKSPVFLLIIAGLVLWAALNYEDVINLIVYVIGLFMPLIVGICIAFILNVLLRSIEKRIFVHIDKHVTRDKLGGRIWYGSRRVLSLVLTIILAFALVIAVMLVIIPELRDTVALLIDEFPDYLAQLEKWLESVLSLFGMTANDIRTHLIDWNEVMDKVNGFISDKGSDVIGSAVGITTSVFSGITTAVLGFVFAMYILAKKETLNVQLKALAIAYLPDGKAHHVISIGMLSNKIFSGFVSGQFTEACILGGLTFIGMSIFQFPFAAMISVLIGFTALIPIVGAFIGVIVGGFLILMQDPITAFWFLVFILVLQQIESNLIYPRVVGKSIGLPGIWVLLAVLVGGSLGGIVGMLIGVPLASVLYTLLQQSVEKKLQNKGLRVEDLENEDKTE